MDEWNTKHHHESGLVERIRTQGVDVKEAERQTLDFLKEWVDYRTAPLVEIVFGMIEDFCKGNERSIEVLTL